MEKRREKDHSASSLFGMSQKTSDVVTSSVSSTTLTSGGLFGNSCNFGTTLSQKTSDVVTSSVPSTTLTSGSFFSNSSVKPKRFAVGTGPTTTTQLATNQAVVPEQATKKENKCSEIMNKSAFAFPAALHLLESQWREMEWTEERKTSLMKTVSSYRPSCEETTQARVLLLGPIGSGKSSFISSVQSVFNGRVTNRAMVGSTSTSFTKKLQSFNIHGQKGEDPSRLVLCDIMGLGDGEMTGLTLHDILSVIKGHVPEGHKFSPDQPVRSETVGYVKRPNLKDRIHCVVFVVDGSKIPTYPKGLRTTFQQLREHISELGVHQVALLTHVDQICTEAAKDVSQVYKSRIIRDRMGEAGALLGMSTSHIIPVKNYSSELDVDVNTDVLLLSAVDHILQYADLYFQDNAPQYAWQKTD